VSFIDLAAITGALAWIPPIFVAIRSWMTKPKIRIVTERSPEIGFTTFGPILNLRIALTVTHKDIVITGIRLIVTHESGEQTNFFWRIIIQRMGTLNYPQGGTVPFEKELNVLAMKISLKDVEELTIRFHDLNYLKSKSQLDDIAIKKLSYLRQAGTFDESFLKSQEIVDVYSFIKQSFAWKPGSYRLQVQLESPDVFNVLDDHYSFTLSPLQVQNLSNNLLYIEQSFVIQVLPAAEGQVPAAIPWQWAYPEMQKVD
jgi:hypothetical protein